MNKEKFLEELHEKIKKILKESGHLQYEDLEFFEWFEKLIDSICEEESANR